MTRIIPLAEIQAIFDKDTNKEETLQILEEIRNQVESHEIRFEVLGYGDQELRDENNLKS